MQFPSESFKTGFLPIQFFIFSFCKIEESWANAKTESVLVLWNYVQSLKQNLPKASLPLSMGSDDCSRERENSPTDRRITTDLWVWGLQHPWFNKLWQGVTATTDHRCSNHDLSCLLKVGQILRTTMPQIALPSLEKVNNQQGSCNVFWDTLCTCRTHFSKTLFRPSWLLLMTTMNCTHCFEASCYCSGSHFRVNNCLILRNKGHWDVTEAINRSNEG